MSPKDETQYRLLDAAGRIFADKGFEGTTVREICQQAKVNIAAVNYYFRDKERLYIEAVKHACRQDTERVPLPEWPAGIPAETRLRDFIRTIANRMIGNDRPRWHTQLILREMTHPTAACSEWVQEQIRPTSKVLGAILKDLLPGASDRTISLTAFSIMGQILFHKVFKPIVTLLVGQEESSAYDAELLAAHIARFTLGALGLEEVSNKNGHGDSSHDLDRTQDAHR
jgi:AcrR family transcriptional regulator